MKKMIVIGSGFGGLSLAIRLQARGFQVTIHEKNEKVGGHAYQFKQDGYTFDLGPSLITIPDLIRRIFTAAGRNMDDYLELIPLNPYYRIYFNDKSFIDYTGDTDKMKAQMGKFNKHDAENYDTFMNYTRQIYEEVIVKGLGSRPFDWKTLMQFAPKALKLKVPAPAYHVVSNYFKDPRNRFVFSFNPLFIGGNPFRASAVYLMIPYLEKIGGIWYTKGGMYSLVQALEKLFLEIGGEIKTLSEVTRIAVENGKATGVFANETLFYAADGVVSNAHFAHTYKDLIPKENRRKWSDRKVDNMAYSMSAFMLYLGLKKQYPDLRHHTLIIAKRYKELIFDIFERKILADDFSMYCHAPTRTDDTMAPKGHESLYVLVPVPNLAARINWQETARPFADKIINFLEQDFGLRDLRANIDLLKFFTPEDFAAHCNNHLGSAWGLEPKVTQTATLRPRNKSEDVDRFYLVGASTHPGAGIPGVMLTAEATENAILKDFDIAP
ncbi:MAG: phytoene desaturase family protein [Candidatus Zhuqueibacterota bacterium]